MELTLEQLRRKRDQAWELAGLARVDGDKADEARWTLEARRLSELITKENFKIVRESI